MQLARPASAPLAGHSSDTLNRLPAREPADPSPLTLAARDEAADRAELGAAWEAEITAHKAALTLAGSTTKAARDLAAAYLSLPCPRDLGSLVAAVDALTDARRAALALGGDPLLTRLLDRAEQQIGLGLAQDRAHAAAVREAAALVAEARQAARGNGVAGAKTALLRARKALVGLAGVEHLARDLTAAEDAFWSRMRKAG